MTRSPRRLLALAFILLAVASGCRSGGMIVRDSDVDRVNFRQRFARGQKLAHYFSRDAHVADAVNEITLETDVISEEREQLWMIAAVDQGGLVTDLYVKTLSHNIRDLGETEEQPGMFDKTFVKWDWIGKAYYGSLIEGTLVDDLEGYLDEPNTSPFGEHFLPRNPLGPGESEVRQDLWRVARILDDLPKNNVSFIEPWTTFYVGDRLNDDYTERTALLKITAIVGVPMPRDPVSTMELKLSFDVEFDLTRGFLKLAKGKMSGHGEAKIPTERGLQRIVTDVEADFLWQTSIAPDDADIHEPRPGEYSQPGHDITTAPKASSTPAASESPAGPLSTPATDKPSELDKPTALDKPAVAPSPAASAAPSP